MKKTINAQCILDPSALLAWMNQEPGCEQIQPYLPGALISAVGLSEVLFYFTKLGAPLTEIQAVLQGLFQIVNYSEAHAWTAAEFDSTVPMEKNLSLGDKASLALGHHLELPVMTANSAWKDLDLAVKIQVIR